MKLSVELLKKQPSDKTFSDTDIQKRLDLIDKYN